MAAFSHRERQALIEICGVGPGVVTRLESLGISTLSALAESDPVHICEQAAADKGSTCWRNSPLAQKAIAEAVDFATRRFVVR
jgi:predicted flap endonuclease-1-like 5' DNA nuclease